MNVGLGSVDNTADANKSVKYATSAGSAGSATKATQDSSSQTITSTYIKGLSVSGRTITYTRGDNTTGTITTQDTNTTYGVGTSTYSGTTKLYTTTGSNTDGTMTQKAISTYVDILTNLDNLHLALHDHAIRPTMKALEFNAFKIIDDVTLFKPGYRCIGFLINEGGYAPQWQVTASIWNGTTAYIQIKSYATGDVTSDVSCCSVWINKTYFPYNPS